MSDAPVELGGLTARLATSATGYAAVIGGVLNVRTVSDSQKAAALNAIYAMGHTVLAPCPNPDCDCIVRLLAHHFPDVRLVPVRIEAEG